MILLQSQGEIPGVWKHLDLTFTLDQLSLVPGLPSPTEVGGVNWKAANHLWVGTPKFCTKSTHDLTICSLAPRGTQSSNNRSINELLQVVFFFNFLKSHCVRLGWET